MKLPAIISALVCEDIRQELSGKFSLAGVFTSDMNVLTLDNPIIAGVFAIAEYVEIGVLETEFRVIDSDSDIILGGDMQVGVTRTDTGPLSFGPFHLKLPKEGTVQFQWRLKGGQWVTIKKFNVVVPPGGAPPWLTGMVVHSQ